MVGRTFQREALHLLSGGACATRRHLSARSSTEGGRDRRSRMNRTTICARWTLAVHRLPFSKSRRPRLTAGPFLRASSCVCRRPEMGEPSVLPRSVCKMSRARVGWLSEMSAGPRGSVCSRRRNPEHRDRAARVSCRNLRTGENLRGACESVLSACPAGAVRYECRSLNVPSSFGLTRPLRPRFGMSNRRPSSLRSVSISRPQRPFSAFFPWSLRAHSSRAKKASPWPSSTALRPFG